MKTLSIQRILISTLLITLIGSVYLNFYFYQMGKDFYLREARVRQDPIGYAQPTDLSTATDGIAVAVVGDSRARHWSMVTSGGIRFLNHGIGNQTTAQIKHRIDRALDEKDAEIFLVEAGINDLKVIPLMPVKKNEITADCIANLQEITTRLAGSGKPVVIATIFPCGDVPLARRMWWSPDVDAAVAKVNRAIREMDGSEGIRVLDADKILADPDGHARGEYQMDQLHLNARAYRALNQSLVLLIDMMRKP